MSINPNRRDVMRTGGLMLAGLAAPNIARSNGAIADITMRSDVDGAHVWFDPIGLLVQPSTTIRWTLKENVHTATAYHPDNDNRSLRIPEMAKPWDSDFLVNPGEVFEVTLTVPGVYDYYCAPHEHGGMVGRIIVGQASGPGGLPFDYFTGLSPVPDWEPVPEMAREMFPSVERILAERIVRI